MYPLPSRLLLRRVRRWLGALLIAVLACTTAGCGGKKDKLVAVRGKVALDGKPLTVGAVTFWPDAAKGNDSLHLAIGDIDGQGNYELFTTRQPGALPGWYKVVVVADANSLDGSNRSAPLPPKWLLNEKYTSMNTTDLSVEVVESPAEGAYDLKVTK